MHQARLGVGVAVVNRLLYAIGGYDGHNRLATAECYHPENDAWNLIKPMSTTRSGAGALSACICHAGIKIINISGVVALGNLIYVIGGYDGENQLKSVETYNTDTNVWEFVAPMSEPRSALSVTALDGKIYAMGKSNEIKQI